MVAGRIGSEFWGVEVGDVDFISTQAGFSPAISRTTGRAPASCGRAVTRFVWAFGRSPSRFDGASSASGVARLGVVGVKLAAVAPDGPAPLPSRRWGVSTRDIDSGTVSDIRSGTVCRPA